MTHDQLFRSLKRGEIAKCYVFQGEEQHIKRRALETLKKALLPEGFEQMALSEFEGAVAPVQISESAETLPFMSERRLVVVTDWTQLAAKGKSDAAAEQFAQWITQIPETCCLVFYQRDAIKGNNKLTQTIKAVAEVIDFSPLGDTELPRWIAQQLSPQGKRMDPDAAEQLVFMAGRMLTTLTQELDKLAAYVGSAPVITRADVEAVVTPSIECTVFQMIDALMAGRMAQVQRFLQAMLEAGETRIGILAMLTRQMRMLTHIHLMRAAGFNLVEIERKLELNHYSAQRAAQQAGRFKAESVEYGYKACIEADFNIKSGRVRDEAALDRLLILLGSMK